MIDWRFYVQAAIAMFMITAPFDPVKILFFNSTIEQQGKKRWPSAIPLIAGAGAIVTIITITSQDESVDALLAALLGAIVVAVACLISFNSLGGLVAKANPRTTALLVRIGGLLLATIGTQMLLGGLKNLFAA